MPKITGLGHGISDLLEAPHALVSTDKSVTGDFRHIPLNSMTPGRFQPRRDFDAEELEQLSKSVKESGVIQPIIVTPFNGGFEIVAGERRWRAAILAGLATIPAIVRDLNDLEIAAITLVENLQRKDLNIVEEAEALRRLHDDFNMTHAEIAIHTGRSRSYISNVLRLLTLEQPILTMLERGELAMGHGRALLGVSPDQRIAIASQVVNDQLTVRATEALVKAGDKPLRPKRAPAKAIVVREEQTRLIAELLRSEVQIRETDGYLYDLRIKCVGASELNKVLRLIAPSLSIG